MDDYFPAEIEDSLKNSSELNEAVQNLLSHENEHIKMKSKEILSRLNQ